MISHQTCIGTVLGITKKSHKTVIYWNFIGSVIMKYDRLKAIICSIIVTLSGRNYCNWKAVSSDYRKTEIKKAYEEMRRQLKASIAL